MKRIADHIREHLMNKTPTLANLRDDVNAMCKRFEELTHNRLAIGRLRYGQKFIGAYNHLSRMSELVKEYKKTGNDELLIDLANYALLEFVYGAHPKKHFKATDDGKHCRKV